jgi:hypothetical protein
MTRVCYCIFCCKSSNWSPYTQWRQFIFLSRFISFCAGEQESSAEGSNTYISASMCVFVSVKVQREITLGPGTVFRTCKALCVYKICKPCYIILFIVSSILKYGSMTAKCLHETRASAASHVAISTIRYFLPAFHLKGKSVLAGRW